MRSRFTYICFGILAAGILSCAVIEKAEAPTPVPAPQIVPVSDHNPEAVVSVLI